MPVLPLDVFWEKLAESRLLSADQISDIRAAYLAAMKDSNSQENQTALAAQQAQHLQERPQQQQHDEHHHQPISTSSVSANPAGVMVRKEAESVAETVAELDREWLDGRWWCYLRHL